MLFESGTDCDDVKKVLDGLKSLRAPFVDLEQHLYPLIEQTLVLAGIDFSSECMIGPRSRIDFLTADGTGIEVKRGKPRTAQVIGQVNRYTSSAAVKSLIVVTASNKNLNLPGTVNGKPVFVLSLNRLWGVSV